MDMSDSRGDMRHHNESDRAIPMSSNMAPLPEPKNVQDLTQYVSVVLQQMQDRFQTMSDQILSRIDEMGTRIDDLEKNIADLMAQAGPEDVEKTNTQF